MPSELEQPAELVSESVAGGMTSGHQSIITGQALECRRQSGTFAAVSMQMPENGMFHTWAVRLLCCVRLLPYNTCTGQCQDCSLHSQTSKMCLVHAGICRPHCPAFNAVFELGEVSGASGQVPKFGELLVRRPVAAAALVPNSVILFTAGAVAGALGTATALMPCLACSLSTAQT